jgi:transposase
VQIPEPDFESIRQQLEKHPNLNLKFLWDEYIRETPEGLRYSQFCERFKRWRQTNAVDLTMVCEHKPGEVMEVDWAGDTPSLLCDAATGELKPVCLFVAALGNSGRLYAEAFQDQTSNHWILAHTHALKHYGVLPRIVTPDNTKTAVVKHIRYDPVLNPAYLEWAGFYGLAVIPARPRKPRDKPVVEGGVRWLQTWLLGRLRNRWFFSLDELNHAIREIMTELDRMPFQKRIGTRLSVFLDVDLPAMRPLPAVHYENPEFRTAKAGSNYHIEFDRCSYSVPHAYAHKRVTVRATTSMVEILHDNLRICSHPRNHDPRRRYVSIPEHMPEKHRRQRERDDWTGDRYRGWASKIGMNTYAVIDAMLDSCAIEEQMYKSCMGVMQLGRKYSEERLEAACTRARRLGSCRFATVNNILKNGQDQLPLPASTAEQPHLPDHENIRGAEYYR